VGDKRVLEDRVRVLEDELRAQISVNKQLAKKLRLIEYQML
jgi:hypothetical protein